MYVLLIASDKISFVLDIDEAVVSGAALAAALKHHTLRVRPFHLVKSIETPVVANYTNHESNGSFSLSTS